VLHLLYYFLIYSSYNKLTQKNLGEPWDVTNVLSKYSTNFSTVIRIIIITTNVPKSQVNIIRHHSWRQNNVNDIYMDTYLEQSIQIFVLIQYKLNSIKK